MSSNTTAMIRTRKMMQNPISTANSHCWIFILWSVVHLLFSSTVVNSFVTVTSSALVKSRHVCDGSPPSYRRGLFVITSTPTTVVLASSPLDNNNGNEEEEDEGTSMDERQRMELVRQLQKSFYSSTTTDASGTIPEEEEVTTTTTTRTTTTEITASSCHLDPSTGRMMNLPLWRVGWVEVPGLANCLNVHEGQYTHMFETILNSGPAPWYVGHLHLPGGFRMTRTGLREFELKTWKEEVQDLQEQQQPYPKQQEPTTQPTPRSAVIGSLLRITDYRRVEDGRLCLLVHVLERFIVDEVVQSFPYSVAHVQILPDREFVLPSTTPSKGAGIGAGAAVSGEEALQVDENFAKLARAAAIRRSFEYHNYEYDHVQLPMTTSRYRNATTNININDDDGESSSNQEDEEDYYVPTDSIDGGEIAKLLPFAVYSSDDSLLDGISSEKNETSSFITTQEEPVSFLGGEPPLEDQLERGGLLQNPTFLLSSSSSSSSRQEQEQQRRIREEMDSDSLETLLWLAVEELCRMTGFVLPEEVRRLVPPHMMDYLDIGDPPIQGLLLEHYPAQRRQLRLSYTLPTLLEGIDGVGVGGGSASRRQMLLNTPTTRARLAAVLEQYQAMNEALLGEFE